jgi:putative ABC transport system permease protein
MESFLKDMRFAVRTLRKQPAFVLTVLLTLALGIGASAAMFGIVDAALLRSLPFREPDRLVFLWGVAGPQRAIRGASTLEIGDWAQRSRALPAVSVFDQLSLNFRTESGADRVQGEMVDPSYFSIVGVRPQLGRVFAAEENATPDAHPVAVISDGMWRDRFAGDPAIVGRAITINDRALTVIGVLPPGFRGMSFTADVWVPTMMMSLNSNPRVLRDRGTRWLAAVARLGDRVSLIDAQHELDGIAGQLAKEYPQTNTDRGVRVFSLRENYLGTTRALLLSLFGAVGLFLLIGCANVVSLQLVRAASRRQEIALRLALGANRQRLVQQLVAEGLVLSLAGMALGLVMAFWILGGLTTLLPQGVLPPYAHPTIDPRVLGFSMGLAILCGVAFGLIPAMQSSRLELVGALKEGRRASGSGVGSLRRPGAQQLLVVAEIALALVLLVGAGLLVRSLKRQLDVDPGFRPEGVLTARLALPPQRYAPPLRAQLVEQLLARLAAVPTVRSAAAGSDIPLAGNSSAAILYVPDAGRDLRFYRHYVSNDYFTTLGISMVRGRPFGVEDAGDSSTSVIVNDATARRFWPGQDPIGRRLRLGDANGPEVSIVGVAANARFRDLTTDLASTEPDVYFPYRRRAPAELQVAVRAVGDLGALAGAVRREVTALDPALPLYNVDLLGTLLQRQTGTARFGSFVLTAFSGIALLLAAIGIYGALSFLVSLGRREIAIRMALGATTGNVLGRLVGQGAALAITGLVIGTFGAIFASRALTSQLFGVSRSDPLTFTAVAALLLLVALSASYLPARRATRVDPLTVLREE